MIVLKGNVPFHWAYSFHIPFINIFYLSKYFMLLLQILISLTYYRLSLIFLMLIIECMLLQLLCGTKEWQLFYVMNEIAAETNYLRKFCHIFLYFEIFLEKKIVFILHFICYFKNTLRYSYVI